MIEIIMEMIEHANSKHQNYMQFVNYKITLSVLTAISMAQILGVEMVNIPGYVDEPLMM